MIEQSLGQKSAHIRVFYLVLITLCSLFFFSFIALVGVQLIWGIPIMKNPAAMNDFTNPDLMPALKFVQFFNAMGMFIVPPLIFSFMCGEYAPAYFRINRAPRMANILLCFLLIVSMMPIIDGLARWNTALHLPDFLNRNFTINFLGQSFHFGSMENWMREMEKSAEILTGKFLDMKSPFSFVITFFIMAVIPAVGEELLFRGVLQKLLTELFSNVHAAVLVTAILFSALHFQFFGFFPRMMLGVVLGYLYVWSGSLWVPIALHFFNNGLAVIFAYLSNIGIIGQDINEIFTGDSSTVYTTISVALSASFLYMIYRMRIKTWTI